ncbi:expressed unknown protein [Seminavis robusta]|uniref:Uncharacterized protein n=1 Tax=Seminavis robusta TaxID=568900 RepID=A0A9N8EBX3_9STRA|nr:expressed unknown protein [Seminavis robusta]|eukprot:Sro724_g193160.1 n/a (429) ;mRNA; r:26118-27506
MEVATQQNSRKRKPECEDRDFSLTQSDIEQEHFGILVENKRAPEHLIPKLRDIVSDSELKSFADNHATLNKPSLKHEIAWWKEELESATTPQERKKAENELYNKQWSLEHRLLLAREERCLEHPMLIEFFAFLQKRKFPWQWDVGIFVGVNEFRIINVEEDYIKKLLTKEAMNSRKYRSGAQIQPSNSDFIVDMEETSYSHIMKSSVGRKFILIEQSGRKTSISYRWAKIQVPKDVVKEAEKTPGKPILLPACSHAVVEGNNNIPSVGHVAEAETFVGLVTKDKSIYGMQKKKQKAQFKKLLHDTLLGWKKNAKGDPKFSSVKIRSQIKNYDPLQNNDDKSKNPIVAEIWGKRHNIRKKGKVENVALNHIVCFVGDLVYDPNWKEALPLSQESLNCICKALSPDGRNFTAASYGGTFWHWEIDLCLAV